jgi:hypothetical protein
MPRGAAEMSAVTVPTAFRAFLLGIVIGVIGLVALAILYPNI